MSGSYEICVLPDIYFFVRSSVKGAPFDKFQLVVYSHPRVLRTPPPKCVSVTTNSRVAGYYPGGR